MGDRKVSRETLFRVKLNPSLRCIFRNSRRIFKPSREERVPPPRREPPKGEVPKDIGTFFKRSSFSRPPPLSPSLSLSLFPLHPSSTSAEGILPSRRRGTTMGERRGKGNPIFGKQSYSAISVRHRLSPAQKCFSILSLKLLKAPP